MAVEAGRVPNENHEPTDRQEACLELLTAGRDVGGPWGRVTSGYVADETEMRRQYASRALRRLETAGWVQKLDKGFYEFVVDPREGSDA
jgi:DNA-binding IclR family transcriptional regulator